MFLGQLLALEEAAAHLGVSPARLRQRLLAGQMIGIKRANAWFVPSLEVKRWADLPRVPHRPLSSERAWRVLADLSQREMDAPDQKLAAQLHSRAERLVLYVHPGLLGKADSEEVVFGGLEALDHSPLVGDYPIRDLYVSEAHAAALRKRLGARPGIEDVNLILHVVDQITSIPRGAHPQHVAQPVAALDLIEGYDARVRALGRDVWARQVAAPA